MKNKIQIALGALVIGMMWSSIASAALLGSTDNTTNLTPLPGTNLVSAVAQGCVMPKLSATRHAFYIDPVHGHITNSGSQTSPWDTLSHVVAMNYLSAKVKPGDAVYLLTGNHGVVQISNLINSDFVTIEAAPGQTPVIDYLQLHGVQKLIFHGIKFQSLKTAAASWQPLIGIYGGGAFSSAISKDIIIDGNLISSADNISGWTQADWSNLPRGGLGADGRSLGHSTTGLTCLTVTNNTFQNISGGVALRSDQTLFSGNTINYFTNDALDFAANDLVISNNKITNFVNNCTYTDPVLAAKYCIHVDAMQGQMSAGPGYSTGTQFYKNINITNNFIAVQTDLNLKFPQPSVQGIDTFISDWTNLTITNNTVIVSDTAGIALDSVHNATVTNNTVLPSTPGEVKAPMIYITLISKPGQVYQGLPSDHVTVSKNITWALSAMSPQIVNSVSENNMVGNYMFWFRANGSLTGSAVPGTKDIYNNEVIPNLLQNFARFDNVNKVYNLNLVANSLLKGSGTTIPVVISAR
jgi:hypothetical protein